jgi:plastocyanin
MKTMKRGLFALAVLLAAPALAHGQATTTEIATGDDFFEPENVESDVGVESFRWAWSTASEHNVVEENALFDSGNPSTTGDFTITPSAGTFNYFCTLHGFIASNGEPSGMAGRVSVRPTATPQGKLVLVTWATEATDTGNRYDVQRKVGKKTKLVEERTKAIEGAYKVKPGQKYQFRVRSLKGKKTASEWSPKLTIKG